MKTFRIATSSILDGAVTEPKFRPAVNNNLNAKRVAKFKYDVAVNGGGFGAPIPLTGDALPASAIVIGGRLYVKTALGSGGAATAALQIVAPGDLVVAAPFAGVPWTPAGEYAVIPVDTAISDILAPAGGVPTITIGVADLNAGVFDLFLDYVVHD